MSTYNAGTEFWECSCVLACTVQCIFFGFVPLNFFGWEDSWKTPVWMWSKLNSMRFPVQPLQQRLLKSLFRSVFGEKTWPQNSSTALSLSRSSEIILTHHLAGRSCRQTLEKKGDAYQMFPNQVPFSGYLPPWHPESSDYSGSPFAPVPKCPYPRCKLSSKATISRTKPAKAHSKPVG